MNGVLGMLQMLMDTDLDATQQDYAQTAHASGKDLISLINEVLDQAKIESGRLELEDVPFDLRSVLDNVLSLFSGRSNEKGIEVWLKFSAFYFSNVLTSLCRFLYYDYGFLCERSWRFMFRVGCLELSSAIPDAFDRLSLIWLETRSRSVMGKVLLFSFLCSVAWIRKQIL